MIYVLLFLTNTWSNYGTITAEFHGKEACEHAAQSMAKVVDKRSVWACVPKGTPKEISK